MSPPLFSKASLPKKARLFDASRLARALAYSLAGLRGAWQSESAFRQEAVLFVILLPASFLVSVSTLERLALIASLGLVLIVELLNSAIEALADRVSTEQHPLTGRAKDYGSAAVMIAMSTALVVWGTILLPRIF